MEPSQKKAAILNFPINESTIKKSFCHENTKS